MPSKINPDGTVVPGTTWTLDTPSTTISGMETTPEERADALKFALHPTNVIDGMVPLVAERVAALIRDLDLALAEIARLTAALAEARKDQNAARKEAADWRKEWTAATAALGEAQGREMGMVTFARDCAAKAREEEREAVTSILGSTIALETTIADDRAASGDTEHEYQHRYAIELLSALRLDIRARST